MNRWVRWVALVIEELMKFLTVCAGPGPGRLPGFVTGSAPAQGVSPTPARPGTPPPHAWDGGNAIRWLRIEMLRAGCYSEALARLRPLMEKYL